MLLHSHTIQAGKARSDAGPQPLGQLFSSRIFQAWEVVQLAMIEFVLQFPDNLVDIIKIDNPAGVLTHFAPDSELYVKRMPMHTVASVGRRYVRQIARGRKIESKK